MALIGPLVFLLLIGLIVTVLGVFRMQQVSRLAHEAARWASVHGEEWEHSTRSRPVTAEDVVRQAMLPLAQGLSEQHLTPDVSWNEDRSLVRVTVNYRWLPEVFLSASTITATSMRPVSY